MAIIRRGQKLYLYRRVPRRFADLDSRTFVYLALGTEDTAEAKEKAPKVWRELVAGWEAKLAGHDPDALVRFEAARELAAARGYRYKTVDELAEGPIEELLYRLRRLDAEGKLGAIGGDGSDADVATLAADLGTVPRPPLTLRQGFDVFLDLTEDRVAKKSPAQLKHWKQVRKKAVDNLVKVIGDKAIRDVDRDDALAFRTWLRARLAKGVSANTLNKDLYHLSGIWRTVEEMKRIGLDAKLWAGLRFDEETTTRPTWSRTQVAALVAPGVLNGLNAAARDLLLLMVNTGARPSELCNLTPEEIVLDAEVPFLDIGGSNARRLKTAHSPRPIPLVGVSLDAARRNPQGFPRYADKSTGWSNLTNKFLRDNKLTPTPAHTAYGLRHAFEDRLLAVEAPDRIASDLMGHTTKRPRYGAGAELKHLLEWVERIAVDASGTYSGVKREKKGDNQGGEAGPDDEDPVGGER